MKDTAKLDYLLVCLMEECAEAQKIASKIIRFGLFDYNEKELARNIDVLEKELLDLSAIKHMLDVELQLDLTSEHAETFIEEKVFRILNYREKYVSADHQKNELDSSS